jgi:hypothetical protein
LRIKLLGCRVKAIRDDVLATVMHVIEKGEQAEREIAIDFLRHRGAPKTFV